MGQTTDFVELIEATVAPAPAGRARLSLKGKAVQFSVDGGAFGSAAPYARPGADLGDADATIQPTTDAASCYTMPESTMTANRIVTLGTTGSPVTAGIVQIIRRDRSANTLTVKVGSTTLIVFSASPASAQGASFYFDGTTYNLLSFYYVA